MLGEAAVGLVNSIPSTGQQVYSQDLSSGLREAVVGLVLRLALGWGFRESTMKKPIYLQVNFMMVNATYELVSQLPPEEACEKIRALLEKEGVRFRSEELFVASTSTPVALLGIQPSLYSHQNWVGINPFAFISSIDVRCSDGRNGTTKLSINVNRRRAFIFVGFWVICAYLAARAMPEPAGALMLIAVSSAAWMALVSFLSGHLLVKEIRNKLKS